jgi:hypothetical protein
MRGPSVALGFRTIAWIGGGDVAVAPGGARPRKDHSALPVIEKLRALPQPLSRPSVDLVEGPGMRVAGATPSSLDRLASHCSFVSGGGASISARNIRG